MAYLDIIGFESGSTTEISSGVTAGCTVQGTTKRTGDYALRINASAAAERGAIARAEATLYVTCYVRVATAPSANASPIFRYGAAASTVAEVTMDTDRTCKIVGSTTSSATSALALNTWYRLDMKFVQNGTCELQVDGATAVTCTGNNNVPSFFYYGSRVTTVTYDIYYDDSAFNDSAIPGAGQCFRMDPDGAGTYTAWTGTFADVDEVPHDSDTTYLAFSTISTAETVTLESTALAGLVGTPKAVKASVIYRATVTGTTAMQIRLRSGSTDSDSATLTSSTSYVLQGNVYNTDPNGGGAWTASALDSIEIGGECVANVAEHRATAMYAMVWEDGVAAGADPEIALIRGGKLVGGGLLLKGGLRG